MIGSGCRQVAPTNSSQILFERKRNRTARCLEFLSARGLLDVVPVRDSRAFRAGHPRSHGVSLIERSYRPEASWILPSQWLVKGAFDRDRTESRARSNGRYRSQPTCWPRDSVAARSIAWAGSDLDARNAALDDSCHPPGRSPRGYTVRFLRRSPTNRQTGQRAALEPRFTT